MEESGPDSPRAGVASIPWAVWAVVLPAGGYLVAFAYEAGYCIAVGIPLWLIEPRLPTIVLAVAATANILLGLYGFTDIALRRGGPRLRRTTAWLLEQGTTHLLFIACAYLLVGTLSLSVLSGAIGAAVVIFLVKLIRRVIRRRQSLSPSDPNPTRDGLDEVLGFGGDNRPIVLACLATWCAAIALGMGALSSFASRQHLFSPVPGQGADPQRFYVLLRAYEGAAVATYLDIGPKDQRRVVLEPDSLAIFESAANLPRPVFRLRFNVHSLPTPDTIRAAAAAAKKYP